MSTSANVVEYTIFKDGETAGHFSKNFLCKYPDYAELLKYQPLEKHTILTYGYDEEEEYWEDEEKPLESFLKRMCVSNPWIRSYFKGEKTSDQILNELKDIQIELNNKMFAGMKNRLKTNKDE